MKKGKVKIKKPRAFVILAEQWFSEGCFLGNPIYNMIGLTGNELQAKEWVRDTNKKTGNRVLALQVPIRFDSAHNYEDL